MTISAVNIIQNIHSACTCTSIIYSQSLKHATDIQQLDYCSSPPKRPWVLNWDFQKFRGWAFTRTQNKEGKKLRFSKVWGWAFG